VLKIEVFSPAVREGYEEIPLVGISPGGHGVLLYATEYPHDVKAVVVLAPFLGGCVVSNAIDDAGGLENWEDCPFMGWNYACHLWKSLKDYMANPQKRTNMYLGYGTEDIFAREYRILAGMLPPENVFTVSGGHERTTWKKLWLTALDHFQVVKSDRRSQNKRD
jgi:enterochelin esterase-like enzyme